MIRTLLLAAALGCAGASSAANRFAWFDEAGLGMFIHWGLYAIPARGEWILNREKMDVREYDKLAESFCPPASFSPEEWVRLAKRMGARYAVLTTRHHDGFALFDTKTTDFNTVKTAAKRDFVREFVDACRRHGLRVGLYYSIMNWQYRPKADGSFAPEVWEAQVRCTHEALRELMSNYGRIDMLWYDGCTAPGAVDASEMDRRWRIRELNEMVRSLQPDILINDRSHRDSDFVTPEQSLAAPPVGQRWESCMTVNGSWGYKEGDREWKSPETLIRSVLHCARHGGNLLLNIGPKPDGSVPPECVKRLEALGDYLRLCPQSFYGATRDAYTEAVHEAGPVTKANGAYWLHALDGRTRLDGAANMTRVAKGIYRVELKPGAKPANWLGGRHDLAVRAGDAPVLGDTTSHFMPPDGDLEPASDATVRLPAGGSWRVEIGYVNAEGFKDTAVFRESVDGPCEKTYAVAGAKGYYARRVTPEWKAVSPRKWSVAGTFPDAFVATESYQVVKDALKTDMPELASRSAFVPVGDANEASDRAFERVNSVYSAPKPGFGYSLAKTTVSSDRDRTLYAALGCDWWGDVYVNGERVMTGKGADEPQFMGWKPKAFPLRLRRGENEILVFNHGGRGAHWFVLHVNEESGQ